jgi:hypothetical protein
MTDHQVEGRVVIKVTVPEPVEINIDKDGENDE